MLKVRKEMSEIAAGLVMGMVGALFGLTPHVARAEARDLISCSEGNVNYGGASFLRVYGDDAGGYYYRHYSCDTYTGKRECIGDEARPITQSRYEGRPTGSYENEEVSITPFYRTMVLMHFKKTGESHQFTSCRT